MLIAAGADKKFLDPTLSRQFHFIEAKLESDAWFAGPRLSGADIMMSFPIETAADRVKHIVQCAFAGRRIVIFSGGATVLDDDTFLDEIRAIHAGGGFGSIIGRNTFQRPREKALKLLSEVMDIYASA